VSRSLIWLHVVQRLAGFGRPVESRVCQSLIRLHVIHRLARPGRSFENTSRFRVCQSLIGLHVVHRLARAGLPIDNSRVCQSLIRLHVIHWLAGLFFSRPRGEGVRSGIVGTQDDQQSHGRHGEQSGLAKHDRTLSGDKLVNRLPVLP
jgi:hypothetical protein